MRQELERIVDEAREYLVCLGSRSREASYLDRIAAKLTHEPRLTHYRVLWGKPHHDVMIPHLRRLLSLQSLRESQDGAGRIRIGLFCDWKLEPERFLVGNEHEALMVMPPPGRQLRLRHRLPQRRHGGARPRVCDRPLQLQPAGDHRRRRGAPAAAQRRMTESAIPTPRSDAPAPPLDSIIALTRELVRTPSRGVEDSSGPVLQVVREWLEDRGLPVAVLRSAAGEPVATVVELLGGEPGPTYCLDACLDTAAFGDLDAWHTAPTEAAVADGRLYGRGAADSKIAVAIFSHLAAELLSETQHFHGRLLVLFDADEHTGNFAGVKTFVRDYPDVDGVMIGYPGSDGVIVGARGFYRATVTLYGVSAHSGDRKGDGQNAVERAAPLVNALSTTALPTGSTPAFPLEPSLTVTGVQGGDGFSMVPDTCRVMIDVRLTPNFAADEARELLAGVVNDVDVQRLGRAPARIDEAESWPAYRLAETSRVANALLTAARRHHHRATAARVCGPSNTGNFFSSHGIDATCGFGVSYHNLHAPNEAIETDTIPMAFRVYRDAVRDLLLPTTADEGNPLEGRGPELRR